MDKADDLINIFQDTHDWIDSCAELNIATAAAMNSAKLYLEGEAPVVSKFRPFAATKITVTQHRSFQAASALAQEWPGLKIGVLNFASATNPGGGVIAGSSTQEECLCRCSNLYNTLDQQEFWDNYYMFHRRQNNPVYSDACIYSPDILVIKSDEELPRRLSREAWQKVDILTCAAPNQNTGKVRISFDNLWEIHVKRARHIMTVAAGHGIGVLVLGAFGCGAFGNSPEIVARAYKTVLEEFKGYFAHIEFAVYCKNHLDNYQTFNEVLGNLNSLAV